MPHEKTRFDLDNTYTPERKVILDEEEPTHEQALEKLFPRAVELVKAHRNSVVQQVEELLRKYGDFSRFPQKEVEKLAYGFGDQTEMVELIAGLLQKGKETRYQ